MGRSIALQELETVVFQDLVVTGCIVPEYCWSKAGRLFWCFFFFSYREQSFPQRNAGTKEIDVSTLKDFT